MYWRVNVIQKDWDPGSCTGSNSIATAYLAKFPEEQRETFITGNGDFDECCIPIKVNYQSGKSEPSVEDYRPSAQWWSVAPFNLIPLTGRVKQPKLFKLYASLKWFQIGRVTRVAISLPELFLKLSILALFLLVQGSILNNFNNFLAKEFKEIVIVEYRRLKEIGQASRFSRSRTVEAKPAK